MECFWDKINDVLLCNVILYDFQWQNLYLLFKFSHKLRTGWEFETLCLSEGCSQVTKCEVKQIFVDNSTCSIMETSAAGSSLGPGMRSMGCSRVGQAGPAGRVHPSAPQGTEHWGYQHLPWAGQGQCLAVSLWVGPAGQEPWLDRAGLWRAGAQPCCGLSGAGTGGPGAAMGC